VECKFGRCRARRCASKKQALKRIILEFDGMVLGERYEFATYAKP
jgi:hypothetical protein